MINSSYAKGDYDWLYANYLGDSHGRLTKAVIALCEKEEPSVAVDLCAGTGHLSRELVYLCTNRVIAVDNSEAMLARFRDKVWALNGTASRVETLAMDLNTENAVDYILTEVGTKANLVTCRQGIGYLSQATLMQVPNLLAPGGSFLFNTFLEPTTKPWVKKRKQGILEAGVYIPWLKKVAHIQRRGRRVDVTHFVWHDIDRLFTPLWTLLGFNVKRQEKGRSVLYTVTRN